MMHCHSIFYSFIYVMWAFLKCELVLWIEKEYEVILCFEEQHYINAEFVSEVDFVLLQVF